MLPKHTREKWQNNNSNPCLPDPHSPKSFHCVLAVHSPLPELCPHPHSSGEGRVFIAVQWAELTVVRHCQQELLDFSCTNSLSCSSLGVFNGGSLWLFSGLMGFSLLIPRDEVGPAVLGIIPFWWAMTSGLESADLQAERGGCQRFLQLNLDWWTRIIPAAGLMELASPAIFLNVCVRCSILAMFYLYYFFSTVGVHHLD